jgi:hypothetical protein
MSDAKVFWTTVSLLSENGLLNEGDDFRSVGDELQLDPTKVYSACADYWNELDPDNKLAWPAVDAVLRDHADFLGTRKIGEGGWLYRYSRPRLALPRLDLVYRQEGGRP